MNELKMIVASMGGLVAVSMLICGTAAALYIIRTAIEFLRYLAYLLDGPAMRGPLNREGREQLEAIIAAAIVIADRQRQTEALDPPEPDAARQDPRRPRS
ncbi:MAG: hypothetical protein MRY63_02530 [Neomegalonema sp.]|nr:hypothetical protein [Neomegalonema sp.]